MQLRIEEQIRTDVKYSTMIFHMGIVVHLVFLVWGLVGQIRYLHAFNNSDQCKEVWIWNLLYCTSNVVSLGRHVKNCFDRCNTGYVHIIEFPMLIWSLVLFYGIDDVCVKQWEANAQPHFVLTYTIIAALMLIGGIVKCQIDTIQHDQYPYITFH